MGIRCLRVTLLVVCRWNVEAKTAKLRMQPVPGNLVEFRVQVPKKTGCGLATPLQSETFFKTFTEIRADLTGQESQGNKHDGCSGTQRQIKTMRQKSLESTNDRRDRYVNGKDPCLLIVMIKYRTH